MQVSPEQLQAAVVRSAQIAQAKATRDRLQVQIEVHRSAIDRLTAVAEKPAPAVESPELFLFLVDMHRTLCVVYADLLADTLGDMQEKHKGVTQFLEAAESPIASPSRVKL